MITAFMNGLIGLSVSLGIGTKYFEMDLADILIAVLAANFAVIIALLCTLKAEKIQWITKYVLNRSLKTWSFLSAIFLLIVTTASPPLRNLSTLAGMLFPLILSAGFGIIIFGPIQDGFVRRQQRRNRAK
jgi:hypothetical protein